MIIYLDNCCYNRPFDDQTQERIHLESEVILTVLKMGQMKQVVIAGSDILELEMNRMQEIRAFDSLHIASAEQAGADVFLTTDDKLEKMAEKLALGTRVVNPLRFAWEVI